MRWLAPKSGGLQTLANPHCRRRSAYAAATGRSRRVWWWRRSEFDGEGFDRMCEFRAREGFRQCEVSPSRLSPGTLLDEDEFRIAGVMLDHGTPCLAFAFEDDFMALAPVRVGPECRLRARWPRRLPRIPHEISRRRPRSPQLAGFLLLRFG